MKFFSLPLIAFAIGIFAECVPAQSFPVVTKFVAPPYPPAALAVRAEGDVIILVEVNEGGHVDSAAATVGHPLLGKAAEFAAKEWIFSPSPGTHYLSLVFQFRLPKEKDKDSAKLMGSYTLQFTKRRVQIRQTVSYQASIFPDEEP